MIGLQSAGHNRTISFRIPAGIREGGKIKLAGQGNPGFNGAPGGDLFLKVKFAQGGRFNIEDNNLSASLDLTPWEAALGAEIPFETIDGGILVKIPPGVQTGSKIRVAGKGYGDRKGKRGDLYIKVRIMNPPSLSKEERQLYEKLKSVSGFKPAR